MKGGVVVDAPPAAHGAGDGHRGDHERRRDAPRKPRVQARRQVGARQPPGPRAQRNGQQTAERVRCAPRPAVHRTAPPRYGRQRQHRAAPAARVQPGRQPVAARGQCHRAPGPQRVHRRRQLAPGQTPERLPGDVLRALAEEAHRHRAVRGHPAQRPQRIGGDVLSADARGAPAQAADLPGEPRRGPEGGAARSAVRREGGPRLVRVRPRPPRGGQQPAARLGHRGRARGGRQGRHLVHGRSQHPFLAGEDGLLAGGGRERAAYGQQRGRARRTGDEQGAALRHRGQIAADAHERLAHRVLEAERVAALHVPAAAQGLEGAGGGRGHEAAVVRAALAAEQQRVVVGELVRARIGARARPVGAGEQPVPRRERRPGQRDLGLEPVDPVPYRGHRQCGVRRAEHDGAGQRGGDGGPGREGVCGAVSAASPRRVAVRRRPAGSRWWCRPRPGRGRARRAARPAPRPRPVRGAAGGVPARARRSSRGCR